MKDITEGVGDNKEHCDPGKGHEGRDLSTPTSESYRGEGCAFVSLPFCVVCVAAIASL